MFKSFIIGYVSGIISTLLCICGCYIYRRAVRRTSADGESITATEQRQSDVCKRLDSNERTASKLIQKAKDILDSGKHTSSN